VKEIKVEVIAGAADILAIHTNMADSKETADHYCPLHGCRTCGWHGNALQFKEERGATSR
jgi:hypothetical protein